MSALIDWYTLTSPDGRVTVELPCHEFAIETETRGPRFHASCVIEYTKYSVSQGMDDKKGKDPGGNYQARLAEAKRYSRSGGTLNLIEISGRSAFASGGCGVGSPVCEVVVNDAPRWPIVLHITPPIQTVPRGSVVGTGDAEVAKLELEISRRVYSSIGIKGR